MPNFVSWVLAFLHLFLLRRKELGFLRPCWLNKVNHKSGTKIGDSYSHQMIQFKFIRSVFQKCTFNEMVSDSEMMVRRKTDENCFVFLQASVTLSHWATGNEDYFFLVYEAVTLQIWKNLNFRFLYKMLEWTLFLKEIMNEPLMNMCLTCEPCKVHLYQPTV